MLDLYSRRLVGWSIAEHMRAELVITAPNAAAAVILALDYGRLPWIALVLACGFGMYGLLKKFAAAPSAESLTNATFGT